MTLSSFDTISSERKNYTTKNGTRKDTNWYYFGMKTRCVQLQEQHGTYLMDNLNREGDFKRNG